MDESLAEDDSILEALEYLDTEASEVPLEILISDDRMQAHIQTITAHTSWKLVEQKLQIKGICNGIRKSVLIDALDSVRDSGEEIENFLVAQGTLPEQGPPLEIYFNHLPSPGEITDDDSIDFRSRDAVPQAKENELLACLYSDRDVQTGRDIFGTEVPHLDRKPVVLKAGVNIRIEEHQDRKSYYSTMAGWARIDKEVISVRPYFRHDGDVDYRVGNIKFDGDVEITGDVFSRFRVQSGGDVVVHGSVERGAKVFAEGNLTVHKGVIGANIQCGGDFLSLYVQESRLKIGGDLRVANYISDSTVVVGGRAVITDNIAKNAFHLSGGEFNVRHSLDVPTIGSANNRPSVVRIGVNPEDEDRLSRYHAGISFCNLRSQQASRLLENLLGQNCTPENFKRIMRQTSEGRRKIVVSRLKEIKKLKKLRSSLEFHIEKIETTQRKSFADVSIRIREKVFARVIISFGNLTYSTDEVLKKGRFYLNDISGPIRYSED